MLLIHFFKLLRGFELAAIALAVSVPFSVLISAIYRKRSCSLGFSCQLSLNIVVIAVLQVYVFVHTTFRVICSLGFRPVLAGRDYTCGCVSEILIHAQHINVCICI